MTLKTRPETIITLMSQANVEQDTFCKLVRPVNDVRVAVTGNSHASIAGSELPSVGTLATLNYCPVTIKKIPITRKLDIRQP